MQAPTPQSPVSDATKSPPTKSPVTHGVSPPRSGGQLQAGRSRSPQPRSPQRMGWTPLSWGSPLNASFRLGRPISDAGDDPTVRSTACLELRVQAVSARQKEAYQRLSDLHCVVGCVVDDSNASIDELHATQRELDSLNQQQFELEVALAKARARDDLQPKLQTSCSGCLQFEQKLVAHRAELDRQLEAFRAEIHTQKAELERVRQEAEVRKVAEAARWEAEQAQAAEDEARLQQIASFRQQVEEDEALLQGLATRVDAASGEMCQLYKVHEDMSLKYQKTGEECIGVLTELESLKKVLEPLQPQAADLDAKASLQNQEFHCIQSDLAAARNQAVQEAHAMREFRPRAQQMLGASENEIKSVFATLKNLQQKHDQLAELLLKNKDNIDLVEGDVDKVKTWVRIATCPPDMHQLGEDD